MAYSNKQTKTSMFKRGNYVTFIQNPSQHGSKKFKFGVDPEHTRGAYPNVGDQGKIVKRIHGGWCLVHMNNGCLAKARSTTMKLTHEVESAIASAKKATGNHLDTMDLLIKSSSVKTLEASLEAEVKKNKDLKLMNDELLARASERNSILNAVRTQLRQLEETRDAREELLQAQTKLLQTSSAFFNKLRELNLPSNWEELKQYQEDAAAKAVQPSEDWEVDAGEDEYDCIGCESGVDCDASHTCNSMHTPSPVRQGAYGFGVAASSR